MALRALRLGGWNRARSFDINMGGATLGSNAVSTFRVGRRYPPRNSAGERCQSAFSLISIGIELAIVEQTKRGRCRRAVHNRALFRGGVLDDVKLVRDRCRGAIEEQEGQDSQTHAGVTRSSRPLRVSKRLHWPEPPGARADHAAASEPKLHRKRLHWPEPPGARADHAAASEPKLDRVTT